MFANTPDLKRRLDIVTTIAMLLVSMVCLGWVAKTRLLRPGPIILEPAPPEEPQMLDGAAILGNPRAPVAIIEYSNFFCPACAKFAEDTIPQLAAKYLNTGRVLLAFRHYPAGSINPLAYKAAEAAACAGRQNKFWELHDLLYRTEGVDLLSVERNLTSMAMRANLDTKTFAECLNGKTRREINEDAGSGLVLSIKGTPVLFIGRVLDDGRVRVTKRVMGAMSLQALSQVLDPLLEGVPATDR